MDQINLNVCMNVLEFYGIRNIKYFDDEISACCPFHKGGMERHPSWGMRTNGVYHCFTCGEKGNLLTLIRKLENCSTEEADVKLSYFIQDFIDAEEDFLEKITNILTGPKDSLKETLPVITGHLKEMYTNVFHPWALSRVNGDEEVLKTYGIGYDKKWNRLIIPHYFKHELRGFVFKYFSSNARYTNSPRLPVATTFFNFDQAKLFDEVCLVESPFDAIRAYSWRWKNVIANFGTSIAQPKVDLLVENWPKVTLAFDNDNEGRRAAISYAEKLCDKVSLFILEFPEGKKDLGDLNRKEMIECFRDAKPYVASELSKIFPDDGLFFGADI